MGQGNGMAVGSNLSCLSPKTFQYDTTLGFQAEVGTAVGLDEQSILPLSSYRLAVTWFELFWLFENALDSIKVS